MRDAFERPLTIPFPAGLRNISLRAPFMHNGSVQTMRNVVEHYATGGIQRSSLSPLMVSFELTQRDIDDIIAFMDSLTEEVTEVPTPVLPAN